MSSKEESPLLIAFEGEFKDFIQKESIVSGISPVTVVKDAIWLYANTVPAIRQSDAELRLVINESLLDGEDKTVPVIKKLANALFTLISGDKPGTTTYVFDSNWIRSRHDFKHLRPSSNEDSSGE